MRASADLNRCKERNGIIQCRLRLKHVEPHDYTSTRKPHNNEAGYIASLRSGKDRAYVVIYEAAEQGIDVGGMRYAVVCQAHNTIVGDTSMPNARASMKAPASFCEGCR